MTSLKLNETPVRTSKSFNINNIKINNLEEYENVQEFSNIQIINSTPKIKIDNKKTPINLKFGLGEFLTEQVRKNSNQNSEIKIENETINKIDNKTNNKARNNF